MKAHFETVQTNNCNQKPELFVQNVTDKYAFAATIFLGGVNLCHVLQVVLLIIHSSSVSLTIHDIYYENHRQSNLCSMNTST